MRERLEKAEGAAADVDEEKDDQIFRLTEITTREISAVDRGANGHRFLLVKRSDDMSGDDKGEQVTANKDGELQTGGGEGGASGDPSVPEVLSLTKAAKESLAAGVKKAVDGLTVLQARLEKAAEVEEGDVPEEVGKALTDAAKALVDAFPGEEAGVDVEKVGRKMAGARLKRLHAALKLISDLVSEVSGGVHDDDDEKDKKTDAKKNAESAKSVQDAITEAVAKALDDGLSPVVETLKSVQEGVSANARRVEEIAKTPGGTRQGVNVTDPPKSAQTKKKEGGFRGGDLNASEVSDDRNFD